MFNPRIKICFKVFSFVKLQVDYEDPEELLLPYFISNCKVIHSMAVSTVYMTLYCISGIGNEHQRKIGDNQEYQLCVGEFKSQIGYQFLFGLQDHLTILYFHINNKILVI